jgi:GNAT superfamily N-acetyltransferase
MPTAYAAPEGFTIRALDPDDVDAAAPALATVLLDCVEGGASVSFMADLTRQAAESFWRGVADEGRADGRVVLVAEDNAEIVGVVEVIPAWADNQPHRADIAKMLVHRRARRRGLAEALLRAAEAAAADMAKTLLVLDTVTGGDAERLYARAGWTKVGVIPDYALFPDGRFCDTTVFYKRVGS